MYRSKIGTILSDEKMVLDLGVHKLRFIKAPMVHWPEVTFTYDETDKVLFSADAFGTFGAIHGSIFADAVDYADVYGVEGRRYYTNTTGKYGMQVLSALKKTEALPIDIICSLHGACPSHGEGQGVCDRACEEMASLHRIMHRLPSFSPPPMAIPRWQ